VNEVNTGISNSKVNAYFKEQGGNFMNNYNLSQYFRLYSGLAPHDYGEATTYAKLAYLSGRAGDHISPFLDHSDRVFDIPLSSDIVHTVDTERSRQPGLLLFCVYRLQFFLVWAYSRSFVCDCVCLFQ